MKIRRTYSISGLLFLTTIVAIGVYYIDRKMHPSVTDLLAELFSMIPLVGRSFLDDPATKDQLLEAERSQEQFSQKM